MQSPTIKLYSIFGDVVLIPVKPKSKKPLHAGWNTVTFADTQDPAYQRELAAGYNIGIVLGPASDGVMAIDIDRDDLVEPFLQLNPMLAHTTRRKGAKGCQFFIRLSPGCAYPNSKAVYALKDANGQKYGEWRCGGGGLGAQSVVFGVHEAGMTYQLVVDKPPLVVDWKDIQWFAPFGSAATQGSTKGASCIAGAAPPAPTATPAGGQPSPAQMQQIYADLFAAFGEPFIQGPKSYNVNQPFFARLWGLKRLAFYDKASEDGSLRYFR